MQRFILMGNSVFFNLYVFTLLIISCNCFVFECVGKFRELIIMFKMVTANHSFFTVKEWHF